MQPRLLCLEFREAAKNATEWQIEALASLQNAILS
jgi:hypothetical protein